MSERGPRPDMQSGPVMTKGREQMNMSIKKAISITLVVMLLSVSSAGIAEKVLSFGGDNGGSFTNAVGEETVSVDIASWRYSENTTNAEINASISNYKTDDDEYRANGGVNAADSYLSARKYTTDERNTNHVLRGSSGYISFGTETNFMEGDYYQFQLSTKGYDNITLSLLQRITGGGPGDFVLMYSYTGDDDDYHGMGVSLSRRYSGTVEMTDLLKLPAECWDQELLYLRLTIVGTTAQGGGMITTTGTWGIDDIVFTSTTGDIGPGDGDDDDDDVIVSWMYSSSREDSNDSVNASINDYMVGSFATRANGGEYADDAYLSARKWTTQERNIDYHLRGSSGYISFGGNPANIFRIGDYYQFQLSTVGCYDITFTIEQRLSAGGPGDLEMYYSYTGSDDDFRSMGVTLTKRGPNATSVYTDVLELPEECEDQEILYLRFAISGNTAHNGSASISPTGTWGIDNIIFDGIKDGGEIEIASWRYSPNHTNDEVNGAIWVNMIGEFATRANGGVYADDSYISGRKWSTQERAIDHALLGSSCYISFGSAPGNEFREGDYYQFKLSTLGYDNVNMSILQRITGGGPGDFVLLYSYTGDDDDFHDMGVTLSRRYSGTVEVTDLLMLPAECWDQELLYLRLTIVGKTAQGGGTITATGTWGIDNIIFSSGLDDKFLDQYLTMEVLTADVLANRGDTVEVEVVISNTSTFNIENVNVFVEPPYFAIMTGGSPHAVIDIQPGQTITLQYSCMVLAGGREAFFAMLEKNGAALTAYSGISVSGPGYYSGDNHSHTTYSDGSGSVADNVNEAFYNKMLSWLYSTDHNTFQQTEDTIAQTSRFDGMFLNIAGNEFTAYNGHMLYFGYFENLIDEVVPYNLTQSITEADKLTGYDYGNLEKWQAIVDFIVGNGGIVYYAHPYSATLGFDNRSGVQDDSTLRDIRNYNGFEVWNGNYMSAGNVQSRDTWDKVNTMGTGHYAGLATSDAHAPNNIGVEYIKAFMSELSADQIHSVLGNGTYFLSNGPEIRFDIDGVGISETLQITDNRKADFNVHVYSPLYNITKVNIIKNTITGNFELKREVVYTHNFNGEKTNVLDLMLQIDVKPGEFYRVEVESERALTTSTSAGYALTNNIWIGNGTSNAANLGDIEYAGTGAEVKMLPTGIYYLTVSEGEVFDLSKLTATVSSGASLAKAYDAGTSIVTFTITAADGTVRTADVFVLGETAEPPFVPETMGLSPGSTERDMNFNWYSDAEGSTVSVVQIVKAADLVGGDFPATGIITVNGTTGDAVSGKKWHKAGVTGLEYDTEYAYRVSNDGNVFSEIYTFRTTAQGSFTFVAVGDPQISGTNGTGMQDSNSLNDIVMTAEGWAYTLSLIEEWFPYASFMAGTGDQVDTGNNEYQYANYFADYLRSLPVAPSVGNHEGTYANFGYHFNVPNQTSGEYFGNYWYKYNNALFIVLNTAPYPATTEEAMIYIMTMDATMNMAVTMNPDVDWIFVQHHKSTTSPASHQTDADVLIWAPLFNRLMDKYGVDFVLSGHDHIYSRSYFIYDNQVVEGIDYTANDVTDPQGTLYFTLTTASGLKYYDYLASAPANPQWVPANPGDLLYEGGNTITIPSGKPWYANIGIQYKVPQFTVVDVTDVSVTFKTYRTDTMEIIDEYTVRKTSASEYTVEFVDWDGTVLKTENVIEGGAATAPEVPAREGYSFKGWDKDFSSVTGNMTVTAQYTAIGSGVIIGKPVATVLAVTNTGNGPIGPLCVSLEGHDASAMFLLSESIAKIDAGATAYVVVVMKDGLPAGDYFATVVVSDACGVIGRYDVKMTIEPVYGIETDMKGTRTITSEIEDYATAETITVTVKNTGNIASRTLTLSLSGENADAFELSASTIGSIEMNGTDTFTVTPKTGLKAGTYTAIVTISGVDGISASFTVSFTVDPKVYEIGTGGQQSVVITVTNTGNMPTGPLSVSISGPNASDMVLSSTEIGNIAVGGSDSVIVVLKADLPEGTYNAIVTISGGNGIMSNYFVSFIVEAS